MNRQSY